MNYPEQKKIRSILIDELQYWNSLCSFFYHLDTILLIKPSNACFGQQQWFLCENQHGNPSPLLSCIVLKHPSGHELPIKQNGAIPYHLHIPSTDFGITVINRRRKTVVVINEEAIKKEDNYIYKKENKIY